MLWEALLSVFGSARQVEAELAHPLIWQLICAQVRRHNPHRPDRHLPDRPMRRHHYLYGRTRHLTDPHTFRALADPPPDTRRHTGPPVGTARPRRSRFVDPPAPDPHAPRRRQGHRPAVPGQTRRHPPRQDHRRTPTPRRAEPDAGLHWEGTGEAAWGTKFVLVAARSPHLRGRIILDIDPVPKPGGEAAVAMGCFERLAPHCPGAQGVIYDTALRGIHHQRLLRDLGWLSINRVTAAKAGSTKARRDTAEQRQPKSAWIETKTIRHPDGTTSTIDLYARDGQIGIGRLTDTGDLDFVPLRRVRTHRNADKSRPVPLVQRPRPPPLGRRRHHHRPTAPERRRRPTRRSTAPRTSGPSHPTTPTSTGSTPAATTPSPSTATSTTPSGSDAPTPSATPANTPTSSASPSA